MFLGDLGCSHCDKNGEDPLGLKGFSERFLFGYFKSLYRLPSRDNIAGEV